jgi:uncharacterized protein YegL
MFEAEEIYPETEKVPVVLVLDTSSSMCGEPIKELNEAVNLFISELKSDEKARKSADVAVVTFGNGDVVEYPFTIVDKCEGFNFECGGVTPMGEALERALDLIEDRKRFYNENGITYYRPWLVLITDGYPTDMSKGDSRWNNIKTKLEDFESRKKVWAWAFGVSTADMNALKDLFNVERVFRLSDTSTFKIVFKWLSASVSQTSAEGDSATVKNPSDLNGIFRV